MRRCAACSRMKLFVVLGSRLDGFGPVELFQDHDTGQMVGECHLPHGQEQIRLGFQRRFDAIGGANEKTPKNGLESFTRAS